MLNCRYSLLQERGSPTSQGRSKGKDKEILALSGTVREATLDCTGGWYTRQRWSGVPVEALLERAGIIDGARSPVTF
jgi:hypothetical protein